MTKFENFKSKFAFTLVLSDRLAKLDALRNGNCILITGASGVGKTTLVQNGFNVRFAAKTNEQGEFASTTKMQDYSASMDDQTLVLTDTPGDDARVHELTDKVIRERIDGAKIQGVINVVASGYSVTSGQELTPEFTDAFLNEKRAKDLEFIEHLFSNTLSIEPDVWFITVVNKQDLWSGSPSGGLSHYGTGATYETIVKKYISGPVDCVGASSIGDETGFTQLYDSLRRMQSGRSSKAQASA